MGGVTGNPRELLLRFYQQTVSCLSGEPLVRAALADEDLDGEVSLLAVGKAALGMTRGALADERIRVAEGLVIHPDDLSPSSLPAGIEVIAADHPLPGDGSFRAGERVLEFLSGLTPERPLLVLLSGGGSSLMESPREGVTAADLLRIHEWLLGSGLDIVAVNRVRQAVSAVKGGSLARQSATADIRVYCLADVPPGNLAALASGPFLPPIEGPLPALPDWISVLTGRDSPEPVPSVPHRLLADAATLREAVGELARSEGIDCQVRDEWLEGDAADVGRRLAEAVLDGPPGLQVWSGETTVTLPALPGQGGRCQQLALAAAERFAGRDDVLLLACGSDGLDGPEGDAGAVVDGHTVDRGEQGDLAVTDALDWADAGRFLANAGDLITVGPTGTNLNDLVIGLRLN